MTEDDLRVLVREFRSSVSSDLESQHQRMDVLADEMRRRITTAETTIVNELRALSSRLDLRLGRIETRLNELERP